MAIVYDFTWIEASLCVLKEISINVSIINGTVTYKIVHSHLQNDNMSKLTNWMFLRKNKILMCKLCNFVVYRHLDMNGHKVADTPFHMQRDESIQLSHLLVRVYVERRLYRW